MYAIANVIYGFMIPQEVFMASNEDDESIESKITQIIENFSNSDNGVLQYYSGSSNFPPTAIGVKLCRFNECRDVKISSLILNPSDSHINDFQQKFNNLPEEIKEYFEGQIPCVFILWSTS